METKYDRLSGGNPLMPRTPPEPLSSLIVEGGTGGFAGPGAGGPNRQIMGALQLLDRLPDQCSEPNLLVSRPPPTKQVRGGS